MIKIKYLDLLVISQHYRVTFKEFIVIIFVSHTSLETRNFLAQAMERSKARPHSVKTFKSIRQNTKSFILGGHFFLGGGGALGAGDWTEVNIKS